MARYIFDIETDNLLDALTLCHCVCYHNYDTGNSGSITDYDEMRRFFSQPDLTIIGHNICRFDIPALEKILGMKIIARLVDTLALSWYLYPMQEIHGLEWWGEFFGVPKPVVNDWQNQSLESYIIRCSTDVVINLNLFKKMMTYLEEIYNSDYNLINRLIDYLTWKLDCAREQEEVRWKLDIDKANSNLSELVIIKEAKTDELIAAMPEVHLKSTMKPPKKPFKEDGSVSAVGEKWFAKLESLGLPKEWNEPIKFLNGQTEPGNPNSHAQMKDWLFSLGWQPITFKYVAEEEVINEVKVKTGKNRAIPQIGDDGKLCRSVKLLIENNPAVAVLDGLFIVSHRISILNGFLENVSEDGYLKAEIAGFTNTLRFKHKTIVNLPTVAKPYGQMIREVLICDEGYELCGSDMSSLEDSTKRHYMFYYDPEYVEEMSDPSYDPHLDIAMQGELVTLEEANFYKWKDGKLDVSEVSIRYTSMSSEEQSAEVKRLGTSRKSGKVVNFSCVYGAGPPKIALSSGMPLSLAKILHKAYWKRNWSVKQIAKDAFVKTTKDGQMWLFNPISQFYYSLRFDKDRFSTLNQGTGVYCFDNQVAQVRSRGIRLCGQFHDEIAFPTPVGTRESIKIILKDSIQAVNDKLKLNVKLGISIDFGNSYAAIH